MAAKTRDDLDALLSAFGFTKYLPTNGQVTRGYQWQGKTHRATRSVKYQCRWSSPLYSLYVYYYTDCIKVRDQRGAEIRGFQLHTNFFTTHEAYTYLTERIFNHE